MIIGFRLGFLSYVSEKHNLKHPCLDCILRPMECDNNSCEIRSTFIKLHFSELTLYDEEFRRIHSTDKP